MQLKKIMLVVVFSIGAPEISCSGRLERGGRFNEKARAKGVWIRRETAKKYQAKKDTSPAHPCNSAGCARLKAPLLSPECRMSRPSQRKTTSSATLVA